MNKRRIPTDKEWFNYKNNKFAGWLYCFMCSSATYQDKLYYNKNNFRADFPTIKKGLGINDNRTINKYITILKNQGYIVEDTNNYYFPFVKNQGSYILIDKKLLYNLCTTKSALTTQIFVYLLNRMKMKRELFNENIYNFTLKELRIILGYSADSQNSRVENAIRECLQTLKAENYIDYNNIYVDILVNNIPEKVPNYQLTFITEKILPKLSEIKEKEENKTK